MRGVPHHVHFLAQRPLGEQSVQRGEPDRETDLDHDEPGRQARDRRSPAGSVAVDQQRVAPLARIAADRRRWRRSRPPAGRTSPHRSSESGRGNTSASGNTQFSGDIERSSPATTLARDMSDSSSSPCTVIRPLPVGDRVTSDTSSLVHPTGSSTRPCAS